MAKKRKAPQDTQGSDAASPAPKRVAGMPGDGAADNTPDRKTDATAPLEKVLVLCSRGITYRCGELVGCPNSSRPRGAGTDT